MKCINQQQANRVAKAGAAKMNGQGYTLRSEVNFLPLANQNRFQVRKVDGTRYVVNLFHRTCSCPFHAENKEFKTCKHLVWADTEKAYTLHAEEAAAAFDAEQAGAEEWADMQIEAGLQKAGYHG
jgi:hypothetical protein